MTTSTARVLNEAIEVEHPEQRKRSELGNFVSIICFKQAIRGAEEALGAQAARVGLTAAGRDRGRQLVESLGLQGSVSSPVEALPKLQAALGAGGTRLCNVLSIEQQGDEYVMRVSEAIETCEEPPGTMARCSYTMGGLQGALDTLTGRRWRAKHAAVAPDNGGVDTFLFWPV